MHARYFYSFTNVWMHYLFDILLYNSMIFSYLRILCLHKWSYDYNIDICVYIFANIYAINIVNYSRNIYCEFKFILYTQSYITTYIRPLGTMFYLWNMMKYDIYGTYVCMYDLYILKIFFIFYIYVLCIVRPFCNKTIFTTSNLILIYRNWYLRKWKLNIFKFHSLLFGVYVTIFSKLAEAILNSRECSGISIYLLYDCDRIIMYV